MRSNLGDFTKTLLARDEVVAKVTGPNNLSETNLNKKNQFCLEIQKKKAEIFLKIKSGKKKSKSTNFKKSL